MRLGAGVADCRELGKEMGRVVTSGHDVPHAWQPRGRRLEVGRGVTGRARGLPRSSWLAPLCMEESNSCSNSE